ncbi:hypothetical protein LXA43DRAFT_1063894 [Ganoderma leucocontextum]|nr:hypothetical protein LXA43DRAFT_1063894 [Ganoderma leucocontextum]
MASSQLHRILDIDLVSVATRRDSVDALNYFHEFNDSTPRLQALWPAIQSLYLFHHSHPRRFATHRHPKPRHMAFYKKAQVAFSMPGITFSKEAGTEGERAVHLLLTQYAPYRYVLVVCSKDGRDGATPQEILLRVKVPDDRVTFDFFEITRVVTVTRGDAVSSLRFHFPADFFEINRIISKAKRVDAVDQLVIDALVEDAINNIPRGLGSSVAKGVQVATEELDESEGTPEAGAFTSGTEEADLVKADLADPSDDGDATESEETSTGAPQ